MSKKFSVGSLDAGIGCICLGFKKSGLMFFGQMNMTKMLVLPYRENFTHILKKMF